MSDKTRRILIVIVYSVCIIGILVAAKQGKFDKKADFEVKTLDFRKVGDRYLAEDLTEIFTIDKIYPSMFGPVDYHYVTIYESEKPELLWITAARQKVVKEDGRTPMSQEYLCHGNLALGHQQQEYEARPRQFGTQTARKLFSLIQGQTKIEFPKNFGIPVISNEPFVAGAMALNNTPVDEPFNLRVRSEFEYIRDAETAEPVKPLIRKMIAVKAPVQYKLNAEASCDTDEINVTDGKGSPKGSHIGGFQPQVNQVTTAVHDEFIESGKNGQLMESHFYVPPGRHIYRYQLVGDELFPIDTTVHYIGVHLHPYGQSLELVDLTTNEIVYKSHAKNFPDRPGLDEIEHYSSERGLPVYKDHEYELISVYDNPTEKNIDAMAVMSLYLHDINFNRARLNI